MRNRRIMLAAAAIGAVIFFRFGIKPLPVQGQARPGTGFAAVPGEKGGLDIYGPYEVVPGWPKPLSQLPGHENWTWGTVNAVFAESPNRIFIGQRGELPLLKRPEDAPVHRMTLRRSNGMVMARSPIRAARWSPLPRRRPPRKGRLRTQPIPNAGSFGRWQRGASG